MVSTDSQLALPSDLESNLNKLRQLNTQNIQSTWYWYDQDISVTDVFDSRVLNEWNLAPLNNREHIAWEKGHQVRWLIQVISVPTNFRGYPLIGLTLRLALTWWAEDAQIYVDGTLVQSGDLFECFTRICLSESAQPNSAFRVAIRLVSPDHDDGALVRSHITYELPEQPTPEPSFIADELTVLATLEPTTQLDIQVALNQLDWKSLTAAQASPNADELWKTLSAASPLPPATVHPFQQSLSQLRHSLLPYAAKLKQRTIQCVGHAHLDMAWLWPIADTWDAAERTFRSILSLQKDFPHLTYTHSSPALFEWIEQHRPELFQQIQNKVKAGSWSIDAGLWVEPEFNIIGGEAIVRHILYGQRYCQQKFGALSKVAWLPDSFGFCWQLPQLLVQGGIETFATLKLSWNDTTEFPYQLFWWQSPDGTRIRALMLPPIGTDIDPIKMSAHAAKWENSTQIPNILWLPGLGDHGGGPTRDMLEKSQRWEKSPFFPKLAFTTPERYIANLPNPASLPVWSSDLYLELHRGCYTAHAEQKQNNRYCEDLLYQAEAFATIAHIVLNKPYPKENIELAWKTLLFNQFHDILPGTSIPEVFSEADEGWEQVKQIGESVLEESLSAIADSIQRSPQPHPNAKPIIVFNSLAWPRTSVVALNLSTIDPDQTYKSWTAYDDEQNIVATQNASNSFDPATTQHIQQIFFSATNIPALGYKCYWLTPSQTLHTKPKRPNSYQLDNAFITVSISATTGQITSLIEKTTNREVLSSPGNQLQLFRDQSGYWDAWNIDPDYQEHPLTSPQLTSIEWHEVGPNRQCIRTKYRTEQSTFCQDYILDNHSPSLTVKHNINWQETHVLLKANFPLALTAPCATYETAFGSITRTTQPTTEAEKAQWEVPALRWADLTQTAGDTFGVSILTQAKHGFDASPTHVRLTLLKSSTWPDPTADKGHHQFTYAIYPHSGTWQSARSVHYARELNIPAIAFYSTSNNHSALPKTHSFLQIHNPNLILSAFKPTEKNQNQFSLRFYEAYGQSAQVNITNSLGLATSSSESQRTNILEEALSKDESTTIHPYQVVTYQTQKSPATKS